MILTRAKTKWNFLFRVFCLPKKFNFFLYISLSFFGFALWSFCDVMAKKICIRFYRNLEAKYFFCVMYYLFPMLSHGFEILFCLQITQRDCVHELQLLMLISNETMIASNRMHTNEVDNVVNDFIMMMMMNVYVESFCTQEIILLQTVN